VDCRKAFDLVLRNLLWEKLLQTGVHGKVLDIVKDMYSKAKSCVKTSLGLSNFFVSNVGLRQGEHLSPILFYLFVNDLKSFLSMNVPSTLAKDFFC
jgi:hypothetical protein